MTQSELMEMLEAVVETTVEEKLLEILGDPDEGLELREAVQDRLIRQRQAVAKGRYGQPLEDVVRELWDAPFAGTGPDDAKHQVCGHP
jgi:hypothetical protein